MAFLFKQAIIALFAVSGADLGFADYSQCLEGKETSFQANGNPKSDALPADKNATAPQPDTESDGKGKEDNKDGESDECEADLSTSQPDSGSTISEPEIKGGISHPAEQNTTTAEEQQEPASDSAKDAEETSPKETSPKETSPKETSPKETSPKENEAVNSGNTEDDKGEEENDGTDNDEEAEDDDECEEDTEDTAALAQDNLVPSNSAKDISFDTSKTKSAATKDSPPKQLKFAPQQGNTKNLGSKDSNSKDSDSENSDERNSANKASDKKPANTKADDTKAADTRADTKAADTKSADTQAADTKDANTKTSEATEDDTQAQNASMPTGNTGGATQPWTYLHNKETIPFSSSNAKVPARPKNHATTTVSTFPQTPRIPPISNPPSSNMAQWAAGPARAAAAAAGRTAANTSPPRRLPQASTAKATAAKAAGCVSGSRMKASAHATGKSVVSMPAIRVSRSMSWLRITVRIRGMSSGAPCRISMAIWDTLIWQSVRPAGEMWWLALRGRCLARAKGLRSLIKNVSVLGSGL